MTADRALSAFFTITTHAPAVARALRPALVRAAYMGSEQVRSATAANGRRLLSNPTDADLRKFGLAVVGSFYDFVCDVASASTATRDQLLSRVGSITGTDHYHAARAAGRGAVLVTAHMGSFEAGLAALPPERAIHVVFKRDSQGGFERLRRQLREQLDVREAPIDDGMATWMKLKAALEADEVVAVQADRTLPGQKGLVVPILGGSIALPTGPFKLALAANAPVIPIFSTRRGNGVIDLRIEPAIAATDPDVGVARYASILSHQLSRTPEQWLVLHRAFYEDQSAELG